MMIKKRTLLSAVFLAAFIAGGGGIRSVVADEIEPAETLEDLVCSPGEIAKFNGADWVCAPDEVGGVGLGLTVTDSSTPDPLTVGTAIGADTEAVIVALNVTDGANPVATVPVRVTGSLLSGNLAELFFSTNACDTTPFASVPLPDTIWPAVAIRDNTRVYVDSGLDPVLEANLVDALDFRLFLGPGGGCTAISGPAMVPEFVIKFVQVDSLPFVAPFSVSGP